MSIIKLWSEDKEIRRGVCLNKDTTFEQFKEKAKNTMGYEGRFCMECGTEILDEECLRVFAAQNQPLTYASNNNKISSIRDNNLKNEQIRPSLNVDQVDARISEENPVFEQHSIPVRILSPRQRSLATDDEMYTYKMNHNKRGEIVMICNMYFTVNGFNMREGCNLDVDALTKTFTNVGFKLFNPDHPEQTRDEMFATIREVAKKDHSDSDCLVVVLMSHGVKEGGVEVIVGMDGKTISIEKLIEPLKQCTSLAGKPKIIIVQACRGVECDKALNVEVHDAVGVVGEEEVSRLIPAAADFLFAYASPPGQYARRSETEGSRFIQFLCREMDQRYDKVDFLTLLTQVNYRMAYFDGEHKVVSSWVSTLTKDIYF